MLVKAKSGVAEIELLRGRVFTLTCKERKIFTSWDAVWRIQIRKATPVSSGNIDSELSTTLAIQESQTQPGP